MKLRPYQAACLRDAIEWVSQATPPARVLYAAPTGSGKGVVQLALREALAAGGLDALILSPSLDVLRGLLERTGHSTAALSEDALAAAALEHCHATTPTRLQNRVLSGDALLPDVILYDEVHHAVDSNAVSGTLAAIHGDDALWIGFTATPFRASPAETKALREEWGPPRTILTLADAVEGGWCALPRCRVVPLLDDDKVTIAGGEFQTTSSGKAVASVADAIAAHLLATFAADAPEPARPTVVAAPSTEAVGAIVEACDRIGLDATAILQHTTAKDRAAAFERCRLGETVLVQIKVVSEGVDLPWLRRLVDARPVTSPVAWQQQLGRIMRPVGPGEAPPEYHCLCRNLERHAYLLGGVLPREAVKQAQEAFGAPSKRAGSRGVGFERLGKFKPIPLPLLGGVKGVMYALAHHPPDSAALVELVVLLDPQASEPLVARRYLGAPGADGRRDYSAPGSEWERVPFSTCEGLDGYGTSQDHSPFSEKQRKVWKQQARGFGLDPDAADSLKRRQYAALPVLRALKAKIGVAR